MDEELKPFTHFTFPNVKQKVPVISTKELLSGETHDEFVLSLVDGLVKHAKQVGFINSGSDPGGMRSLP